MQVPSQLAAGIKTQDKKYTLSVRMQLQLPKQPGSNGLLQKKSKQGGLRAQVLVGNSHLKLYEQKTRQKFFFDLGISTCFLIYPWKSHMLFLNTPGNCMPSTPLFAFFQKSPMNATKSQQLSIKNNIKHTLTYSLILLADCQIANRVK